jgi:hypothetical protein
MTRHLSWALVLGSALALPATAQITPPNIRKPIDAAKNAAGKMSQQIQASQNTGAPAKSGPLPAEAARAADQTKAAQPKAAPVQKAVDARAAGKADIAARPAPDSAKRGIASQAGTKGKVTFYREEFSYSAEGRRDPFISLMATGEVRPMLSDLALIGVIFDPAGQRSVAVLIDATTGETYRVKTGQTIGRMKLQRIGQRDVTLQVDEFGFSRQETLPLDQNPRRPGTGAPRRAP